MASEPAPSESPTRKRQRRSKQDPQFVFEHPVTDKPELESTSPIKSKSKPLRSVESIDTNTDLYEPGDIVWCKLGSFPWWPALIYRCDAEGRIYTKVLNTNNKPKQQFFVYFYGKYLEYSWITTRWLLKYAGLSSFIQHAEAAVHEASTKSEQQELANRYQLKVSMKKRVQWDEAIELADRALTMTNAERIQEFSDLLKEVSDTQHQSKNSVRRRKTSLEKSQEDGEEVQGNKRRARTTSTSSASSTPETNSVAKTAALLRKPIVFSQNGATSTSGDEITLRNKRGRKTKSETLDSETKNNSSNSFASISTDKSSVKTRAKRLSDKNDAVSSPRSTRTSQRTAVVTNGTEIEYDYPSSTRSDQTISPALLHLIPVNIPPLSNFEQKQIVEGLLHHPSETTLTFDEAQTFAIEKAIEIVFDNHNYRMANISPEWFYDAILLKHPSVVFQNRSWFEHVKIDMIPNGNDLIQLKQWQIALMLHAQIQAERHSTSKEN